MPQHITPHTEHLRCYRHEDGSEVCLLLTPYCLQVADLKEGCVRAYKSTTPLTEHEAWISGELYEQGYDACQLQDYIQAQEGCFSGLHSEAFRELKLSRLPE